ncbi:MAG: dimethylsulfonioproprionate lyase family protein [Anderseniella sp.]
MKEIYEAYANTWRSVGAKEIALQIDNLKIDICKDPSPVSSHMKRDLDIALKNATHFPKLQQLLITHGDKLTWAQSNFEMPDTFVGKFDVVRLAGPTGMVHNTEIAFGFYLQQADAAYPSHWHEAVEDYLVVSGTGLWQTDDDAFHPRPPGSYIQHASNQPHAMTTQSEPLLAMWFWQGNIDTSTYRIVGVDY